jgi:glycosyltransferase involved in cell wall biosynthesis
MKQWAGPDDLITEEGLHLHGICQAKELYVDGRRSVGQAVYYSLRLLPVLLRADYDLLDCSSAPYFTIYASRTAALLRRTPLVVTWLEFWGDYWYDYMGRLGFAGKAVEGLAARLPRHILAISDHTRRSLLAHHVPAGRIDTIPCGIDWAAMQAVPPAGGPWDLIFVGRLIREKNVDLLLRVVALLRHTHPAVRCAIIGNGPERERLEALRAEWGLQANVQLLGRLETAEEVYGALKRSRLMVSLSRREGFNIAALEANACGLPVVTLDHPHNATTDWIVDGHNGLVCALPESAIAARIAALLEDEPARAAMAERARENARRFDWAAITLEVEAYYRRVLAAEGRQP